MRRAILTAAVLASTLAFASSADAYPRHRPYHHRMVHHPIHHVLRHRR